MGATQLFPREAEPQRAAGKYETPVCKYQSQSHLSSFERKGEKKACGGGEGWSLRHFHGHTDGCPCAWKCHTVIATGLTSCLIQVRNYRPGACTQDDNRAALL